MSRGWASTTSIANATLWYTSRSGRSLTSWNTTPSRRRSRATWLPRSRRRRYWSTYTSPSVGSSSWYRSRMRLDLPAPLGPTTNTNSPRAMVSDTWSSATCPFGYRFVTDSKRMMATSLQSRSHSTPAASVLADQPSDARPRFAITVAEDRGLGNLSWAVAFGAGLASFLSPCIVPLVPSYLSALAGTSITGADAAALRGRVGLNAAAFVLGFTVILVLAGLMATGLGRFVAAHQRLLAQLGGIVMVLFGLQLTGVIQIGAMERQVGFRARPRRGLMGAFAMGLVFAAGWTPCIGPI